jgi:hypothetical protein
MCQGGGGVGWVRKGLSGGWISPVPDSLVFFRSIACGPHRRTSRRGGAGAGAGAGGDGGWDEANFASLIAAEARNRPVFKVGAYTRGNQWCVSRVPLRGSPHAQPWWVRAHPGVRQCLCGLVVHDVCGVSVARASPRKGPGTWQPSPPRTACATSWASTRQTSRLGHADRCRRAITAPAAAPPAPM